jgi:uncharacterized membrane protein
MKSKKYDNLILGLIIGLIGPFVGFVLFGLLWSQYFNKSFRYFVKDVFFGISEFQSSIVALSLIFNLIPFFLFLRKDRYKSGRGVLLALFIYVPVVIYLRFA